MDVFKQKFDQAELHLHNEEDGECQIEIIMVLTDAHTTCSAVIWLDSEQRKDLIKLLLDMETTK